MNISNRLSSFLDCARWLSALLVVANHLRSIVFVNSKDSTVHHFGASIFYFITDVGHQAVIIFFVLSGFLVGGSIINRVSAGNFNLKLYFIDRISRLYIVLPFALLSGGLLDYFGWNYFNLSGLYTGQIRLETLAYSISQRLNLEYFSSNLLMLQTLLTPTFGSNEPLWSLSNEFWYYALFPVIVLCLTEKQRSKKLLLLAASLILASFMASAHGYGNMLWYFTIWALGASVWLIKKPIFRKAFIPLSMLGVVLFLARNKGLDFLTLFQQDLLIGIVFSLLINSVMHLKDLSDIKTKKLNQFMSSFTYSFYLLHWPLIIFGVAFLHDKTGLALRMQLSSASLLIFIGLLSFAYLYSYLISRLTEHNTHRFRNLLKQAFNH